MDAASSNALLGTTENGGIVTSSNNMNSKVNKRFDQLPENLRFQGQTPSGKPRLFVCEVCTRAFARHEHLIRHTRQHTKEKPYHCGVCERKYGRRDLLLRHVMKMHNGSCGDSVAAVGRKRKSVGTGGARKKGRTFQRRASFSALSAEKYAGTRQATKSSADMGRVEFSTPQMLPVDMATAEQLPRQLAPGASKDTTFNLLDRESWINEMNSLPMLEESSDSGDSPMAMNGIGSQINDWSRRTSHGSAGALPGSLLQPDGVSNSVELKPNLSNISNARRKIPAWKFEGNSLVVNSLFAPGPSPSAWKAVDAGMRVPSLFGESTVKLPKQQHQNDNTHDLISRFNDFKFIPRAGPSSPYDSSQTSRTGNDNYPLGFPAMDPSIEPTQPLEDFGLPYNLDRHAYQTPVEESFFRGMGHPPASTIARGPLPNLRYDTNNTCQFYTEQIRDMCIKTLEYYYQHCSDRGSAYGTNSAPPLDFPSCQDLNLYAGYFQTSFLVHYPFIHPSLLSLGLEDFKNYVHEGCNEHTPDEVFINSNIICLPLFIATIGSLYVHGARTQTLDLYEKSRRALHVYLNTRKKHDEKAPEKSKSRGSLWLIQSLCLSVVFALFADPSERINSEMVTKQVSALCSLLKTSLLPIATTPIADFESSTRYLVHESAIRTVLMGYKVCQFLKVFCNIDAPLFIMDSQLNTTVVPDSEQFWHSVSFQDTPKPCSKQFTTNFEKFYRSFAFNNVGMHLIPEFLCSAMLFYEFNNLIKNRSSVLFQIFLTRIDTKKLELNLPQSDIDIPISSVLIDSAIDMRNSLTCMIFFCRVDPLFSQKAWNNAILELHDSFLTSKKTNVLKNGSYGTITDFLVALNFSIKNISNLFKSCDDSINFNRSKLSVLNLEGYYYNFLVIIKFILDFEATPNFKLLCIYNELKKLANQLLIPKLASIYPAEFQIFNLSDVSSKSSDFSSINMDYLEKLINNVLVYSFNDANFLKMPDNSSKEFVFNPPNTLKTSQASVSEMQLPSQLGRSLVGAGGTAPLGFAELHHLSEKYVVVARCFFFYVFEKFAHAHFLEKLSLDFMALGRQLEHTRGCNALPDNNIKNGIDFAQEQTESPVQSTT